MYNLCVETGTILFNYWGTTMGALRSKAYMPWDDDIDVILVFKNKDVEKFFITRMK